MREVEISTGVPAGHSWQYAPAATEEVLPSANHAGLERLDQWLLDEVVLGKSNFSLNTVALFFFYTFITPSRLKTVPPATAPLPLNTGCPKQVSACIKLPGGGKTRWNVS